MRPLRFIMLGGFLGAGKTTTLARLASHYQAQGLKVALVTNDQAQDLVDTNFLRSRGFAVEEVAGACFCCRFDELVDKVRSLEAANRPDVLLAEPVGSCTDLVATVVQPLRDLYGHRFEVAPYAVLFKPSHGLKILKGESGGGFSPKAEYIFRKQLEEADAIVINRLDELTPKLTAELFELVERAFPTTPVLKMSAKTGEGFELFAAFLEQEGTFGRKILDIDYDIYAEGEAELGWLNAGFTVTATTPFALDDLLLELIERLRGSLSGEVAHLKAIGLGETSFAVANLIASAAAAELSMSCRNTTSEIELIVNARVATDPAQLESEVTQLVPAVCQKFGATAELCSLQSFRPGRPTPTHRYAKAKA